MPLPAVMDEQYLHLSRVQINEFLRRHLEPLPPGRILEIGPKLAWPSFDTLDIDPRVGATHTMDLCTAAGLPDLRDRYDIVLAISVLEHTVSPWSAMANLRDILQPGGLLLAQAPLNFRVHGPLPDLWRFTEHGWRVLLANWDDVKIEPLESPDRPLMPIAYCVSARNNKTKCLDPRTIKDWRWIP